MAAVTDLTSKSERIDRRHMQRAIDLARQGEGHVEPNPMVGCVIAVGDEVIAEGFHRRYGGRHAEVAALESVPEDKQHLLSQSTLYVTLEPCCHHGKTPPCTEKVIESGIGRVVIAAEDPNPKVSGGGIRQLQDAGVEVEIGVANRQASQLNAPFLKLVHHQQPWLIAKWAMTLDGKIASRSLHSQWISSSASRERVHALRGRVDGILIGMGTALADDPILTARPEGARTATRIILDSCARLPLDSQLVKTVDAVPTLVFVGPQAPQVAVRSLRSAGVEVLRLQSASESERLQEALEELGRRRMTNVLVEGGGTILGSLFDAGLVDEVHAYVAPKVIGGVEAPTAVAGAGAESMKNAVGLSQVSWEVIGDDLYMTGRVSKMHASADSM